MGWGDPGECAGGVALDPHSHVQGWLLLWHRGVCSIRIWGFSSWVQIVLFLLLDSGYLFSGSRPASQSSQSKESLPSGTAGGLPEQQTLQSLH